MRRYDDHFAEYLMKSRPPHTREFRNWGGEGVAPFPAIDAEFAIHRKDICSSPFAPHTFKLGMRTATGVYIFLWARVRAKIRKNSQKQASRRGKPTRSKICPTLVPPLPIAEKKQKIESNKVKCNPNDNPVRSAFKVNQARITAGRRM